MTTMTEGHGLLVQRLATRLSLGIEAVDLQLSLHLRDLI